MAAMQNIQQTQRETINVLSCITGQIAELERQQATLQEAIAAMSETEPLAQDEARTEV